MLAAAYVNEDPSPPIIERFDGRGVWRTTNYGQLAIRSVCSAEERWPVTRRSTAGKHAATSNGLDLRWLRWQRAQHGEVNKYDPLSGQAKERRVLIDLKLREDMYLTDRTTHWRSIDEPQDKSP
jgi:hypothetical protein